MDSQIAHGLLELLKAIDTDCPRDFIDLVCWARENLPANTEKQLQEIIDAEAIA